MRLRTASDPHQFLIQETAVRSSREYFQFGSLYSGTEIATVLFVLALAHCVRSESEPAAVAAARGVGGKEQVDTYWRSKVDDFLMTKRA